MTQRIMIPKQKEEKEIDYQELNRLYETEEKLSKLEKRIGMGSIFFGSLAVIFSSGILALITGVIWAAVFGIIITPFAVAVSIYLGSIVGGLRAWIGYILSLIACVLMMFLYYLTSIGMS